MAMTIGFDGVEINGGNGDLLDQFLHSNINTRQDMYGGSVEGRCRFPLELRDALVNAIGASNVALRLEPTGLYRHTRGIERVETWSFICQQVAAKYIGYNKISYVHFIEPRFDRISSEAKRDGFYKSWSLPVVSNAPFRKILDGTPYITCGGYTVETCASPVENDDYDAVAFTRWFVSNPDLPARILHGWPLAGYDRSRLYGSWDGVREKGYTSYLNCQEETLKQVEDAGTSVLAMP